MITHPIALGLAVFLAMMFGMMNKAVAAEEEKGKGKFSHRFLLFMWMLWTAMFATIAVWQ
jgi:hypothetical protein